MKIAKGSIDPYGSPRVKYILGVIFLLPVSNSGPVLASAGPDWKHFSRTHSVACAEIFEGGIKSQ